MQKNYYDKRRNKWNTILPRCQYQRIKNDAILGASQNGPTEQYLHHRSFHPMCYKSTLVGYPNKLCEQRLGLDKLNNLVLSSGVFITGMSLNSVKCGFHEALFVAVWLFSPEI